MDNMLILHSRCDQNVLSKNSLSTVNWSSQCSQDVITGFQVPLPPVTEETLREGTVHNIFIIQEGWELRISCDVDQQKFPLFQFRPGPEEDRISARGSSQTGSAYPSGSTSKSAE